MTAAGLLEALRSSDLLTEEQLGELESLPESQSADPRPLARAILQRGWLTAKQLNLVAAGRTDEARALAAPPPPPPPEPQSEPEIEPEPVKPRHSRAKKPTSKAPLLVGSLIAGAVVLTAAVVAFLLMSGGDKPAPPRGEGDKKVAAKNGSTPRKPADKTPTPDKGTKEPPEKKPPVVKVTPKPKEKPPEKSPPVKPPEAEPEVVFERVGVHHGILGHSAAIRAMAVSPDGKYAATGDDAGLLRLWDLEKLALARTLGQIPDSVGWLTFSPDGKRLGVATAENLHLFDVQSGKPLPAPSLKARCFTPDLSEALILMVKGDRGEIQRFRLPGGEPAGSLPLLEADLTQLAFSPDGKRLAVLTASEFVEVFDLTAGKSLGKFNTGEEREAITGVGLGEGNAVFTGDKKGWVSLIDLTPAVTPTSLPSKAARGRRVQPTFFGPRSFSLAKQGKLLVCATSDQSHLDLINPATGSLTGRLIGAGGAGLLVLAVPGKPWVVSCHEDGALWRWEIDRPNDGDRGSRRSTMPPLPGEIRRLEGHGGPIAAVPFLPGDREAVTAAYNLRHWELDTGKPTFIQPGLRGLALGFGISTDGKLGVVGVEDGTISVWDLTQKRYTFALDPFTQQQRAEGTSPIGSTALSGDGKLAAAVVGGIVRNNQGIVQRGPDGKVTRRPYEVKLWSLDTKATTHIWPAGAAPVGVVSFSRDNKLLFAAGGDAPLRIWDVATGKSLPGWTASGVAVHSLVPLGTQEVALGLADGSIVVWNVPGAKEVRRLVGHKAPVRALAVTPDANRLLSAAGKGSDEKAEEAQLRLWDLSRGETIALCPLTTLPQSVAITAKGNQALLGDAVGLAVLLDLSKLPAGK